MRFSLAVDLKPKMSASKNSIAHDDAGYRSIAEMANVQRYFTI